MPPSSNFQGGIIRVSRVPFLVLIIIFTIIANENGLKMMSMVEGRTWPRLVEPDGFHDHHHEEEIYSTSSPATTTTTASSTTLKQDYNTSSSSLLLEAPKSEINSSLSPILPSPLHLEKAGEDDGHDDDGNNRGSRSRDAAGDYQQDFNGNVSLRCNRRPRHHHYHHHSWNNSRSVVVVGGTGNNDDYNGDGRWWTSNSTNCLAGPFHLGADVNESVYNALCPFSASATNGKFPIQGLRCGAGELYVECVRNKKQGNSAFTVHECEDGESFLDAVTGKCARKSDGGKIETSTLSPATACPMDRDDDESYSDEAVLQWALHQIATPDLKPEESKAEAVEDLQSLEDENDTHSSHDDGDGNDHLGNLCKSTSVTSPIHHRLLPHPHLCTHYVECAADGSDSFFLKSCGPGTVFNSEQLICDWPANVPQCSSDRNGNEVYRRRRTASTTTTSSSGPGALARGRCNFTGIRADPEFCNKYRLCSAGGEESVHTCGVGTVYNQLSEVCDFRDEVDCASRKSDLGTYGCDEGDKYRAPHPDYCNKFVECQGATLAVKNCPPGTLYDREGERCDHAFKVTCRKPISLEHDIDVNWKTGHGHEHYDDGNSMSEAIKRKRRSAEPCRSRRRAPSRNNNKLNLACEYNYIAPHPHSCTRFVECEQGRIYIKTCGPGTAFNPIIGKCDFPRNVREPDAQDCTRYKQCTLRHGYQNRSCPPGQYFEEETRQCVRGNPYQIQQCSGGTRVSSTSTTPRPTVPPFFPTPPPS